MKKLFIISIICLFTLQCEKGWLREILNPTVEGCNISTACNYNPDVNKFDNSCEYISCIDCLGMSHGVATIDSCGTCDAVASNDCIKDCSGEWGGGKIWDCDSVCDGTNLLDHCNVCDADSENDCIADCVGIWGGSAVKDECDICGGGGVCDCLDGNTSCECCCSDGQERDCSGECGGSAVADQCGVCDGDNACLPPDLFSHNQSTLFAYFFIFSAYDYSGEYLEANQDWIGVFNGDVCVGAKLWQGGPTEVPAYGNDGYDYSAGYLIEGDMPTFKIYNASENVYHAAVVNEDIVFQHLAVNNILRMDVYVDCLGVIGGTAVIDICGICNGDGDCEGIDCTDNPSDYCKDLSVLQILIDNSSETINMEMDDNGDGIIEPLELGSQEWEAGRLTELSCHFFSSSGNWDYCDISGEIPNQIGNLTQLTNLVLESNQLHGAIPSEIANLTNLTNLTLSSNQLTGEIPSEIGNLTNLTSLYLSSNQLTGEIPAEIGYLTSLYGINLYNNQLSGEIPAEIGNLVNLTHLFLFNNDLNGIIPDNIDNLINLEHLLLHDNELTGSIPEGIGGMQNVERIFLSNNDLNGIIPESIGNLGNLTHLYLFNNDLNGIIPESIGNLTNLSLLKLFSNDLNGTIPESICNLTNLNWSPNWYWSFSDLYSNQFCPPYPECLVNQEPFTDENNNGIWDEGEPFEDTNGNGIYEENYVGVQDTSNCP